MFNAAYQYLDLVPKGRDEDDLKFSMEWVRGTISIECRTRSGRRTLPNSHG